MDTSMTVKIDANPNPRRSRCNVRTDVSHCLEGNPSPTTRALARFRLEGEVWLIEYKGRGAILRVRRGCATSQRSWRSRTCRSLSLSSTLKGRRFQPVQRLWRRTETRSSIPARGASTSHGSASFGANSRGPRATPTSHAQNANAPSFEALETELLCATGLGGRARRQPGTSERARKAVSNRIRSAIRLIRRVHPELGDHLDRSIQTGRRCRYSPPIS